MSEHGSAAASAPLPGKAGRKAHWISDENFERISQANKNNRYDQQCNHCSDTFTDAKAQTLADHLLMHCTGISPEARAEVVARKAADSKRGTSQAAGMGNWDGFDMTHPAFNDFDFCPQHVQPAAQPTLRSTATGDTIAAYDPAELAAQVVDE
jgi:hypothetical protein